MQIIKSRLGKDKVVHRGHVYVRDKCSKANPDVIFWRCDRKLTCRARLHSNRGDVIKLLNPHTHPPDLIGTEALAVVSRLRHHAHLQRHVPPLDLVGLMTRGLRTEVRAAMPPVRALVLMVRRQRAKMRSFTPEVDVRIFGAWSRIDDASTIDQVFIYSDFKFGKGGGHLIVFLAPDSAASPSVAPLFCAHVSGGRTREEYVSLFRAIREKFPKFRPSQIYCPFDFEMISAIEKSFAPTSLRASLFHFNRAIVNYRRQNSSERIDDWQVPIVFALLFVPICSLQTCIQTLIGCLPQEKRSFLEFFSRNFIGHPQQGRLALYEPQFWSLHDALSDGRCFTAWSELEQIRSRFLLRSTDLNRFANNFHDVCPNLPNTKQASALYFSFSSCSLQNIQLVDGCSDVL